MKKTTELKQELMTYLEKNLAPLEFKRSHQLFHRRTSTGKQILHISIIKRKTYINVVPSVEIRHDQIEKLYHLLLAEPSNLQTATIGCELGKLSGKEIRMLKIESLSNVPRAAQAVLTTFGNTGPPFFEKYSSLERIFSILKKDEIETNIYCPIPHVRAKKALVAVYLLNRKDLYDDLVEKKISYLKTINTSDTIDFLQFSVKLRKMFNPS